MNFALSIFACAAEPDVGWEILFGTICVNHRVGSLFSVKFCPDCGWGLDFFWLGLAIEQPE